MWRIVVSFSQQLTNFRDTNKSENRAEDALCKKDLLGMSAFENLHLCKDILKMYAREINGRVDQMD